MLKNMNAELMPEEVMVQKKVWAVIGATENPKKYGNMIYKKLKKRGYTVYPVNPNVNLVDGDACYPDLSSLPQVLEVIDMVVSPQIGMAILEESARLGIKDVWLQPGTFNDELLTLIKKLNLNAVQACVMVALR